ncbi:hypothetical protein [Furfurilactobacillus entadae]|uniref:hypothetical protein n=1 Tax=Furfurilactobacillus entadae TaxID=2922307 RepID=UPI0035E9B899
MAKYNYDFKARVVAEFLSGISSPTLDIKYHIPQARTIRGWVKQFQIHGSKGLQVQLTHRRYSSPFKQQVLNWMKQHQASYTKRHDPDALSRSCRRMKTILII